MCKYGLSVFWQEFRQLRKDRVLLPRRPLIRGFSGVGSRNIPDLDPGRCHEFRYAAIAKPNFADSLRRWISVQGQFLWYETR